MGSGAVMGAYWLLVALVVQALETNGLNCSTDNCNCKQFENGHIKCKIDGTNVSIHRLLKELTLACEWNSTSLDYSKLPKIAPGSTTLEYITFNLCPLPKTSLGRVISDLGVKSVTAVEFQSSNLSSPIQRKHLQGLNDLQVTRLTLFPSILTELPGDLFIDIPNLQFLWLKSNHARFSKNLFEPLTKLEILMLSNNELKEIPGDMLSHLSFLRKLHLWYNHIQTITKTAFKGLVELSELDMGGNELNELPAEIFENLKKLQNISLHVNKLYSLPSKIFFRNKQLVNVELIDNNANLTTLPEYFLSDMENLKNVRLDRVGLEVIPTNIFTNSTNIVNISLKDNAIKYLPDSLFHYQVNLLLLDLSYNKIKLLPQDIFLGQKSLEYLYLSFNCIESLQSYIFRPLSELKELHMKNNRLKQIVLEAFTGNNQLTFIDMSQNYLDFQPTEDSIPLSPFNTLENLKRLDLSFNSITSIYNDWLINLSELENLNLTHNNINSINFNELVFLSHKIIVDLTFNNIETVNFMEIVEIDPNPTQSAKVLISNNPFDCDCFMTRFLQYLKDELDPQVRARVDVEPGDTACASSPPGTGLRGKVFKQLEPKELLCLPDSESSEIECPKGCDCFERYYDQANILKCNGGSVDRVPDIPFTKPSNHTELHLQNNGFTRILRSGNIPDHVTEMYLNDNRLTQLFAGDIPRNIEVLDLRNNSLQHLNESVAEAVVNGLRLQKLWLAGNPLACDCENMVFLGLVQKNRNKVQDYGELVCPDGKNVAYLLVSALCGTAPVVVAVSALLAITGLALGLAVAAFYKYNQHIKVYLFSRGWFLWWVNEDEVDRDKQYDAFVSFSHKDAEFVMDELIHPLEEGDAPYKLCLHYRDWIVGAMIPDQISRSVLDSRRTIVVLSPNFLASDWATAEFREAHNHAVKEGRARVIVIIYGDIGPTEKLDPDLQSYLATNTYVEWGDSWFWKKLRYALPHRVSQKKRGDKRLSEERYELGTPAHQAQNDSLMQHAN